MTRRTPKPTHGFTLVELLVVIAIIGILVSMLLPAVQAAREAARRTQCLNQMSQMSKASHLHVDTHGFFPSGGWGWRWIGHPDEGYGRNQPGGWAYNLLPYIEESVLRDAGAQSANDADLELQLTAVAATPVPIFNCPSRRGPVAFPYARPTIGPLSNLTPNCTAGACLSVRGDYAGNAGNINLDDPGAGPSSIEAAENFDFLFDNQGNQRLLQNGIIYQVSEVRIAQIVDGTAHTALIGEKLLNPDHQLTGLAGNDDNNLYTGHDFDTIAYTGEFHEGWAPQQDQAGVQLAYQFGSAHPAAMNMAFCDGSVRSIPYDVDELVFKAYGSRDEATEINEAPVVTNPF